MKYAFFLSVVFFVAVLFLIFQIAERELGTSRRAPAAIREASLGGD